MEEELKDNEIDTEDKKVEDKEREEEPIVEVIKMPTNVKWDKYHKFLFAIVVILLICLVFIVCYDYSQANSCNHVIDAFNTLSTQCKNMAIS